MESNNQRPPTAAAWIKKTKKGDDYISVKLKDGTWLNLFKNNRKNSEKSPDYTEIAKKEENNNNDSGFSFNSDIPF